MLGKSPAVRDIELAHPRRIRKETNLLRMQTSLRAVALELYGTPDTGAGHPECPLVPPVVHYHRSQISAVLVVNINGSPDQLRLQSRIVVQ